MGSRGSGGRKRPSVDDQTKGLIKQIEGIEGITAKTKSELVTRAQQNLKQYQSASEKKRGLGDIIQQDKVFGDTKKSILKEASKAKEGTDNKYRARQQIQAKRELLMDRPGQKQLILSRRQ